MQEKFKKYFQTRDQKEKNSNVLLNLKGSVLLLACLATVSLSLQPPIKTAEPKPVAIAEVGGGNTLRMNLQNPQFISTTKPVTTANQNRKKAYQVTLSTEMGSPK